MKFNLLKETQKLMKKSKVTRYRISKITGLDDKTLRRIEEGVNNTGVKTVRHVYDSLEACSEKG